jgi:hypothetical protein
MMRQNSDQSIRSTRLSVTCALALRKTSSTSSSMQHYVVCTNDIVLTASSTRLYVCVLELIKWYVLPPTLP